MRLRVYPRPRSTAELVLARLQGEQRSNSEETTFGTTFEQRDDASALVVRSLEALRPLGRAAHQLGLLQPSSGSREELRVPFFTTEP